ncbi:MAG TPA: hypothetical protein VN621_09295, partial [Arthrobacter sp.]|nr:hypothetical protein [Arthrobacter sp.]
RKAAREALAENARAQVRATVDAAKKEVEHIRAPKDDADAPARRDDGGAPAPGNEGPDGDEGAETLRRK